MKTGSRKAAGLAIVCQNLFIPSAALILKHKGRGQQFVPSLAGALIFCTAGTPDKVLEYNKDPWSIKDRLDGAPSRRGITS